MYVYPNFYRFLQHCESNVLVALIEGCAGAGGDGGDVGTSSHWIASDGY